MTIKDKLVFALTTFDRKQSARKGWNPYALGQYFARIDEVCQEIDNGKTPRQALLAGFSDRVLDVCLLSIGEKPATKDEVLNGPICYR